MYFAVRRNTAVACINTLNGVFYEFSLQKLPLRRNDG